MPCELEKRIHHPRDSTRLELDSRLEEREANIKRANKTQHKSKLVKMKFSEFFRCCCKVDGCCASERLNICINFYFLRFPCMLIIQLSLYLLRTWIPMDSLSRQLLSSYVKISRHQSTFQGCPGRSYHRQARKLKRRHSNQFKLKFSIIFMIFSFPVPTLPAIKREIFICSFFALFRCLFAVSNRLFWINNKDV